MEGEGHDYSLLHVMLHNRETRVRDEGKGGEGRQVGGRV